MSKKDTIYIDVEDDITTLINKTISAKSPIVALVLPKRFSTLQSSVNMKLLKKAASDKKKRVVLITTETGLLPLAAAAGVHVAKNLKTRPEIPSAANTDLPAEAYGEEPEIAADASLDELASAPFKSDVSDEKPESEPVDTPSTSKKSIIDKVKWPGKLKVPNFGKFRTKVILAILALLVFIGGYVLAFMVLPSATVAIVAETSILPTSFNFSASLNSEENNFESGVLAAEVKEVKKTISETYQATGEKDVGEKATGIMTVQNCQTPAPQTLTVPAGTVFTDETTGYEFESTEDVEVPGGQGTFITGCTEAGEADVLVRALQSGDERNLSARGYFVNGFEDVTGFGDQMAGGTSEIVSVVTKADFDKASKALLNQNDDEVLSELTADFGDDVIILGETFEQKASKPNSDPKVGQEANEARVSAEFTYSIVAVNRDAMTQLLEQQQQERIESGDQTILENGLDSAVIQLIENNDGVYTLRLETDAIIGPSLDINAIAEEISGKEYSDAKSTIEQKPGVRSVEIDFSPVWVFNVPSPDKVIITINIEDAVEAPSE